MKIKRLHLVACVFLTLVPSVTFAEAQAEKKVNGEANPTLKVLWGAPTFDVLSDPGVGLMEKYTGYKVEWNALPRGNEEALRKLMLEMSSGEEYDLVKVSPSSFAAILGQGVPMVLDELLGQYGQNILTQVGTELLQVASAGGKQYGIPVGQSNRGLAPAALLARQDILDELGLKKPLTLDEFHATLQSLRKDRPELIPFTMDAGDVPQVIQSGFGFSGTWHKVNNVWTPNIKRPEYRQAVEFMKELYETGLLDEEMPAMQTASRIEKFASGKAVFITYGGSESRILRGLYENFPDARHSYVPSLIGKDGRGYASVAAGYGSITYIPKNAKNPEHAVKWMNIIADEEVFRGIYLGVEGETYEVRDGAYFPILPAFNESRNYIFYFLPLYDEDKVAEYWKARARKDPIVADSHLGVDEVNEPYKFYPPLAYAPLFQNEAKYGAIVDQYVKDEVIKFIVGVRSMSEWEEFLEERDAKGGEKIDEEIGAWLKANK